MENQGYVEEQSREEEPSIHSNSDNHLYEDISLGIDLAESESESESVAVGGNHSIPVQPNVVSKDVLGSPILANTVEYILNKKPCGSTAESETVSNEIRRNLTLPLRRGRVLQNGCNSSSVRVTNRERTNDTQNDPEIESRHLFGSLQENKVDPSRTHLRADLQTDLQTDCRPAKRRRKKDCKHCRNKIVNVASTAENYRKERSTFENEMILGRNAMNREETGVSGASEIEVILATRNFGMVPICRVTGKADVTPSSRETNPSTVFPISENLCSSTSEAFKYAVCEKNLDVGRGTDNLEDKGLILPKKTNTSMRVNSIYSQDRWYAKEPPIFFTDVKDHDSFQRAYSLPIRAQTPSSQNRVNLRRSVRGEPPPHPARLYKHRHGWTLHLARPLEGRGSARSLIFLLILILTLLVIGAFALYIVFEPEKLQIIQQYLRSSAWNSTSRNTTTLPELNISVAQNDQTDNTLTTTVTTVTTLMPTSNNGTVILGLFLSGSSSFPESTWPVTEPEPEMETNRSTDNTTRYCDDCLTGEVCVALVDEDVPICRIGLDPQDPTGCAGFCLINKQRCHRLDVDAFRCVEVEHYCLDDEWTCSNTLCIPLDKHCDGHMNCYDHSDEYNCVCNLETHFQCGNETACLPLEKKCDGNIDCWDAADEINCTLACPMENEFTCSSGQCILKARFCDGLPDCADGSDEPHGCQGRCNKHEFTCQNNRCITKSMKCNGVDDCGDGTDERHCKFSRFSQ